jgi:hypothetical protein
MSINLRGHVNQLSRVVRRALGYPLVAYVLLSGLVTYPWYLRNEYIFMLDMVWGPNRTLSSPIVQKLLLSGLLVTAGLNMHMFMSNLFSKWGRRYSYLAGLIYTINPYVYERLAAGHWLVLLGYAFFPLAFLLLINALNTPTIKNLVFLLLMLLVYPLLSEHWTYMYALLATSYLIFVRPKWSVVKKLSLVMVPVLAWYAVWFLVFSNVSSSEISENNSGFLAFATKSDDRLGVWFNVSSLYGFWSSNLKLTKDYISFWWLFSAAIMSLWLLGVYDAFRSKDRLRQFWFFVFLMSLVLGVGFSSPVSEYVTEMLVKFLPGYVGMRETQKWAGVLAFSYAVLVPAGTRWIVKTVTRYVDNSQVKVVSGTIFGSVSLLVVLNCYTFFGGYAGQLKPTGYPTSWYEAKKIISGQNAASSRKGTTLSLPWHGYMTYGFTEGRIIANPSPVFFTQPVISSKTLDNESLKVQPNEYDDFLFNALNDVTSSDEQKLFLKSQSIGTIVLTKVSDWDRYEFLSNTVVYELIYDSGEISVFAVK